MATKFLDKTGLSHFWSKIKTWCNTVFAPIVHTHTSYAVKHSYTTAANAAKNWYRIVNANTSQTDTTKPIHAQFILTAYNTSYDTGYYERWFVNAEVFGRTAHIVILGNSAAPFSQARILYENTIADLDANDRPAIDIYLNYALANGTTKIEIEEVYNQGWTFVADGQISASIVPSGFENVACSVRNNGVERSTYADYVSYLNRQVSNITAAFTLADSYLYRSRTLNCIGTFTITIPSINSGYMWCVIKNKNTSSGVITLHPSTTSVLIDGSNADITLQPMEYVCIHSAGANNYSLIADGRFSSKTVAIANKLGTITVGASDAPIYLNAGVPIATNSRLNRSLAQYVANDSYSDILQTYQSDNNNYRSCTVRCVNGNGYNEITLGAHNESNAAPGGITVRSTDGTITATAPAPAANANDTRIATTKWVNDKGYITSSGSITGNAATASAVAWSGVTNKPTTISGYGITDAKIANGTITLGSNSITPLTSIPSHNQASNTINAMTGYSKPNSTSAIATSDTLNSAIGKLEKAIDDADISNVVHKTGDEEINGIKKFNRTTLDSSQWCQQQLKVSSELDVSVPSYPSTTRYGGFVFTDKNDAEVGAIYQLFESSGLRKFRIRNFDNSSVGHDYFELAYDPTTGNEWAQAPATLASRSNGNDIVTRNWIPQDDRIVHTTGDELISGIKSFNSNICIETNEWLPIQLRLPNVDYQNSSYPSGTVYTGIGILDAGDHYPGDFYYAFNPDGSRQWVLRQQHDDGTSTSGFRVCYNPGESDCFATIPTAALTENSSRIPNTYWVRNATGNTTLNAATATDLAPGSVLSVAKGGTGSSTQNFVDLNTDQKIYGNKIFGASSLNIETPYTVAGVAPTSDHYSNLEFVDKNGDYMGGLQMSNRTTSNYFRLNLIAHDDINGGSSWYFNASGAFTGPSTPDSPSAGQYLTYDWIPKDTRLLHTTGNESVSGNKTFTNSPIFRAANPYFYIRNSSEDYASTPSANLFSALAFQDKDSDGLVTIRHQKDTSNNMLLELMVRRHNSNDWVEVLLSHESNGTKQFRPASDNNVALGNGSRRWTQLFAGTTSISTSDERLKDNINEFNDDLLNVWDEIDFYNFKFKDSIVEKGDNARIHFGVIAQRIKTVFDKYGIDINNYGFFCYDSWDYQPAVVDDEGIPGQEELLAGDRYSIRYEELLCIEAAYQRRKNKILENRIFELETQVQNMLQILESLKGA